MSPLFCGYSGMFSDPETDKVETIEAFRATQSYRVENGKITCGFNGYFGCRN
jgi:hypothetical protein